MDLRTPYFYQIISTLKNIVVLLLLYTISRLLFFAFNASYFEETSSWNLIKIFFFGIRFDFSALVMFNFVFIFLFLLPFPFVKTKIYSKTLFIIFWIVNASLLLLNFGDIEYFKYISKRSTADVFSFMATGDDVIKLIPQFLRDFWYIPLLWALTVVTGIWLTKTKTISGTTKFKPLNLVTMLLLLAILFTGARGIGVKPLRIISAARYAAPQEIPLLINTPFSIWNTFQEQENVARNYFADGEYQKVFSPLRHYKSFQKRDDNVVILILESFSYEFVGSLSGGKTYTPFLDSLLNHSLTFENGFANCRKSIEGIPAVLAALPSLTNNSYISSHYGGNRLKALPYILGKHGYTTTFFHGGRNGTMSFDEFSKLAGIKYYFGMNEYKGPPAFDNNWGIFDQEFLQYVALETNKLPHPFFEAVFTLSSHHPYTVPEKYNNLFPKDEAPQLRSIRYADMALRNYFATAEKQPWFKNTLFVIVADHTAKAVDKGYSNPVNTFRIPIAFYHPENDLLSGRRKDIAQQIDIMPSIIHYLGIEEPFLAYGTSVFDPAREPYAINYLNNMFYYYKEGYILTFDGENTKSLHHYSSDKLLKNNLVKEKTDTMKMMETKLKATVQDYLVRLEGNKLISN